MKYHLSASNGLYNARASCFGLAEQTRGASRAGRSVVAMSQGTVFAQLDYAGVKTERPYLTLQGIALQCWTRNPITTSKMRSKPLLAGWECNRSTSRVYVPYFAASEPGQTTVTVWGVLARSLTGRSPSFLPSHRLRLPSTSRSRPGSCLQRLLQTIRWSCRTTWKSI